MAGCCATVAGHTSGIGGQGKSGANPVRARHCDRGRPSHAAMAATEPSGTGRRDGNARKPGDPSPIQTVERPRGQGAEGSMRAARATLLVATITLLTGAASAASGARGRPSPDRGRHQHDLRPRRADRRPRHPRRLRQHGAPLRRHQQRRASPAPGRPRWPRRSTRLATLGQTFDGQWYAGFDDYFIRQLGPEREDNNKLWWWGILVNRAFTPGRRLPEARRTAATRCCGSIDAFSNRPFLWLAAAVPTPTVLAGTPLTVTVTSTAGNGGGGTPLRGRPGRRGRRERTAGSRRASPMAARAPPTAAQPSPSTRPAGSG